jgi:hypothetical protein
VTAALLFVALLGLRDARQVRTVRAPIVPPVTA